MTNEKSRKEQLIEQREEQILKAALEVFARKGYGAASIPEIAEAAGVAVGTIYNYYADKHELFIAVMKNLVFSEHFFDIKNIVPEADTTDILKQIIQSRLELSETESGSRIPYLMSEIVRDPELRALWVEQSIQPVFAETEVIYRTVMASGRLRHFDPKVAIRAIAGLVIGFSMLKFLEGEKSPLAQLSQEELTHDLVDFILHGLAPDIEE